MSHTYEELKKRTVAELREIAHGLDPEAVKGYSQLNKEHLLVLVCKTLHIDMHQHREVHGLNKAAVKKLIREMKKKKLESLAAHDHRALHDLRRRIHRLKRRIHKATY